MDNIVANFTSLDGRIGRQSWWIGVVILIVINIVISFLILPLVGISMMPNFAALMADPNNVDAAAIANRDRGDDADRGLGQPRDLPDLPLSERVPVD